MKHRAKRFIQSLVVAVMLGATTQQMAPVELPSFLTQPINPVPQIVGLITQYGPRALGSLLITLATHQFLNIQGAYHQKMASAYTNAILDDQRRIEEILNDGNLSSEQKKNHIALLLNKRTRATERIWLISHMVLRHFASLLISGMVQKWYKNIPTSLLEHLKATLLNLFLAYGLADLINRFLLGNLKSENETVKIAAYLVTFGDAIFATIKNIKNPQEKFNKLHPLIQTHLLQKVYPIKIERLRITEPQRQSFGILRIKGQTKPFTPEQLKMLEQERREGIKVIIE